jgi:hypothetical protein
MMKKFSNPLIVFPVTLAMYSSRFNLLTDNWCYSKKRQIYTRIKINESIYPHTAS